MSEPLAAITSTDVMDSIRQSAMLCDVSISVWGGVRTDRKLLDEIKQRHNARGKVGTVQKNLLTGADGPLEKTKSMYNAVRTRHTQMSLPWVSDPSADRVRGPRLLPVTMVQQYISELGKLKRAAESQLEEFLAEYPSLVQQAQANLNTMVDSSEYPSVDELRGSFRVYFDFEPIPEGTKFQGLDGHTFDVLSKRLGNKQQRQLREAVSHVWRECASRVKHMAEQLAKEDGRFYNSTLEHVKDLVDVLPKWNLTGDPRLTEIHGDLSDLVYGLDPKALGKGKNATVRSEAADAAQKIVDKLSNWGI